MLKFSPHICKHSQSFKNLFFVSHYLQFVNTVSIIIMILLLVLGLVALAACVIE
jgi:hypothetical protein